MPQTFVAQLAERDDWRPAQAGDAAPRPAVAAAAAQRDASALVEYLRAKGFVFEPWQIAAFVAAVRAKPFVILAGISGTGKTKLPGLLAEATGGEAVVVPVRPDWTDGSELLGFERLDRSFRPGALLEFSKRAHEAPDVEMFFILDEMNIARVEYYLAEVLSRIEQRGDGRDGYATPPLLDGAPIVEDVDWSTVGIPPNLCLVGSVNMDETTFGFSRKVLDRAFVIEFSKIDLRMIPALTEAVAVQWTSDEWRGAATTLTSHPEAQSPDLLEVIDVLVRVNEILETAQLQFGYRVRDEICLFWLASRDLHEQFVTSGGAQVDPLDLAVSMKVLPRIQGGGASIALVLDSLHAWAKGADQGGAVRAFPFVADRVELMQSRLKESGFTSYWL
ncbi:McrB family protein [Cellulomonas sp. URHE0023]|uniref:McrB family protein n=1 Tax=Cellulomonas sp. URHE0023 TaxID=1380354 RepID=UPI00068EA672|nr:hypothetical protein [Cellulomonas sp. URHE0023]